MDERTNARMTGQKCRGRDGEGKGGGLSRFLTANSRLIRPMVKNFFPGEPINGKRRKKKEGGKGGIGGNNVAPLFTCSLIVHR